MRKLVIPALVTLVLAVTMVFMASTPETVVCEAPVAELAEIEGFVSEKLEASEAELNILPTDTVIHKRLYTGKGGDWFQVALVIGGKSKNSIHRPELCLPSQGYRMTKPTDIEVGEVSWRCITLDGGPGVASARFAYTFFNQDGFHTSSHVRRIFRDVWDRSVHNRIDRWVMVTVVSSADDDGMRRFLSMLKGGVK